MTFKTGTADDYLDFLEQFIAELCNAGHAYGRSYVGTGNGTLTGTTGAGGGYVGTADSLAETFTLTATDATHFDVVGSTSGNIGEATVGVAFVHALIEFRLNAGGTPFEAGDQFKLSTSPPWELLRKRGTSDAALRTTNMTNGPNLWDRNAGTYAELVSTSLPAHAAIAMIDASEVKRVTVNVWDVASSPTAFALDYSDDGVGWTEAQAWAAVAFSVQESRAFNVTGSHGEHAHWRLRFTASAGALLRIAGVEFLAQVNSDAGLERRAEVILKAPGNDGTSAIYVGLELYEDTSADRHNFNFYGFRSYDPSRSVRTQVNPSGPKCVPLALTAFDWTLAINGRRVAGVARIGSVDVPFYQGLGKPYELPSVHPYPAVNAGTGSSESGAYTATDGNFRGFSSPGRYGLAARYPDQVWREHANRFQQSSDVGDNETHGKVYPASIDAAGNVPNIRDNLDSSRPLYEIVLLHRQSPRHEWGELDGCYYTPGFAIVSGQVITRDGFAHTVFQNTFRTGFNDFFAIRQD